MNITYEEQANHQQDFEDFQGFPDLSTGELCETTQEQLNALLDHEEHLAATTEDLAITDIRSPKGAPVRLEDIQPDTIITVNGISGQVDHMIEAGLVSKSIYAGNYEDYVNDAEDCFEVPEGLEGTQGTPDYINAEALTTTSQVEDAIGSVNTIESITNILSGVEVNHETLQDLAVSYGVTPEIAERELKKATEQIYDDFIVYAENELGIQNVEHFSEWVAYAANRDMKMNQLYQQAVIGALNGDFSLSEDLAKEYKLFYRMF